VAIQGRSALLITGSIVKDVAAWAPRVEQLTGTPVSVGNRTATGALLVRDDREGDVVWALTYGMGFQLLEPRFIDPGFGQRIAVRAADPDDIRSLTRTTIDYRSRTDRSSIPSGEQLRTFGVGDFGEIVSRVVGSATIPGLAAGDDTVTIRGADALSVPLGRTPTSLVADLNVLRTVLARAPLAELEALEQLVPIKSADLIASLDDRLDQALRIEDHARLAVGWPHERIDESSTPTSYRLHGAGRGRTGPFDDTPTLNHLREALNEKDPDGPLEAANSIRVQLYRDADADEQMSSAIPVRKWLAFETDIDGQRHVLHDGRWYLMDHDYADRLHAQVAAIFARDCGVALPNWTPEFADENAYNIAAGQAIDAIVLDRKLIHTQLHRRGIEPCDLITPDGLLIHIKTVKRSSAASHLIAQALVSTDTLLYDHEARRKLRSKIKAAGGDPALLKDRPEQVVVGMAKSTALTADDLFTFTQVTLARLDAVLGAAGVTVYVAPILRQ
jgi:uncharacterized protein (TIGR04141 family)